LARSSSASLRRKATAPRTLARLDQRRSSKVSTTRGSGSVKFQKLETARSQNSQPARLQNSQTAELQKSEIGARRDTQQTGVRIPSRDSDRIAKPEPRLTAMLKTTWRVLKRPFKF
jgi:hypothetical protein